MKANTIIGLVTIATLVTWMIIVHVDLRTKYLENEKRSKGSDSINIKMDSVTNSRGSVHHFIDMDE